MQKAHHIRLVLKTVQSHAVAEFKVSFVFMINITVCDRISIAKLYRFVLCKHPVYMFFKSLFIFPNYHCGSIKNRNIYTYVKYHTIHCGSHWHLWLLYFQFIKINGNWKFSVLVIVKACKYTKITWGCATLLESTDIIIPKIVKVLLDISSSSINI